MNENELISKLEKLLEVIKEEPELKLEMNQLNLFDTIHNVPINPAEQPDEPAPPHMGFMYATDYVTTITTTGSERVADLNDSPVTLYNIKDIDKLIILLTLWIDDRSLIEKMEKMYKQWKELEKIKN